MLTHLVLPTTEHDESTRANLNDSKPEMHFRQKMFDILIKTWCRRARPVRWGGRSVLSTAALEGALEQVRALRVELVKEISQGTGTARGAGTVGFQGGRRDRLPALYESKLIAMTFLYEVRLSVPCLPISSHLSPASGLRRFSHCSISLLTPCKVPPDLRPLPPQRNNRRPPLHNLTHPTAQSPRRALRPKHQQPFPPAHLYSTD